MTFRTYSSYLKEKYGESVYRVAVDAGFSCPNRGMDRTQPGCSYCDEHGSRAPYLALDGLTGLEAIQKQIIRAIGFLNARYKTKRYLLYFQAFSSTYAPAAALKEIYDFALEQAKFAELIVSTRPDCVPSDTIELLQSYQRPDRDVWVELGLQSASDTTLQRINRGHTVETFVNAFQRLRRSGIKITVHLIFGLPGEGEQEILDTIRFVARLSPEGIKIHNLHIPTRCALYQEYLSGCLSLPAAERHLQYTQLALEHLPPQTVIMRLTCDTPQSRLAAPLSFWPKAQFYRRLEQSMKERGTYQGKRFVSRDPL